MNVFGVGNREMSRYVGFIGTLVLRKTRVAVNAEHGPARRAVVHDDILTDAPHGGSKLPDKIQEGIADHLFVAFLIRLEPGPIVVFLQLPKELEKRWGEINRAHVSRAPR